MPASAGRSRSSHPPTARTRAAGSIERISSGPSWPSARTRPRCRACACSSTIPASSPPTSTVFGTHSRSSRTGAVHIAFTAHSIPAAMARSSAYEAQLNETARLVAEAVGVDDWAVVYQSRSGSPEVPWLGPDISEHLAEVAARGIRNVVAAPTGFISDHIEVLYDLDIEARARRRLARARARACQDRRHAPRVRLGARRSDRRADDPRRRAAGARPSRPEPRRMRAGLLPSRQRPSESLGRTRLESRP